MLRVMAMMLALAAAPAHAEACERGIVGKAMDRALNAFGNWGRNADCEWPCWRSGSWIEDPECRWKAN